MYHFLFKEWLTAYELKSDLFLLAFIKDLIQAIQNSLFLDFSSGMGCIFWQPSAPVQVTVGAAKVASICHLYGQGAQIFVQYVLFKKNFWRPGDILRVTFSDGNK